MTEYTQSLTMMSIKNNKKNNANNQKLIQFVKALKKIGSSEENFNRVFQKLGDVNIKVAPTNYLTMYDYRGHLIGNTALHLAYNKTCKDHLSLVLNQGTDFIIKNQDNLTILHLVLRYQSTDSFRFSSLRSTLDNDCVDLILSAHLKTENPTNPCDNNQMSHFHIACMANNVEAVNFFLDNDVFVDHAINSNSPYFAGFTALHLAIRCYCVQVTKILLKHGANIFLKNAKGETALHMVMENYLKCAEDSLLGYFSDFDQWKIRANEEVAQFLLEIVSDNMVIDESGLSCLHLACTMTDSSIAEKLSIKGDINHAIKFKSPLWPGYTPLHFAAHVNVNTVEMLLKRGADLTIKDANGTTPLELCLRIYKIEVVKLLLKHGGNSHLVLHDAKVTVNRTKSATGNFSFYYRNYKGMEKVFRSLGSSSEQLKENEKLQKQAEVKIGLTKIHVACYSGDSEWLRNLLHDGANVNAKLSLDLPECAGFTPLHVVVSDRDSFDYGEGPPKELGLVKALLDAGADVTLSDAKQRTPLHYIHRRSWSHRTVYSNEMTIMVLKAQKNFSVNPIDDQGMSHLHIASKLGETAIVKKFLERCNLDVNQPLDFFKFTSNKDYVDGGFTPLHMAAISDTFGIGINSQLKVVDLLLKYGADPHRQSSRGNTALHVAKRYEIFERICRAGADANSVNAEGHTPLGFLLTEYNYPVGVAASVDHILNWLRCGCTYNAFDIFTGQGYIRRSIDVIPYEKLQNLLEIAVVNMPNAMLVDGMGRTAIHNVVTRCGSAYDHKNSTIQLASLIETLAACGCDVDSQDNLGRTPLHVAVQFKNEAGICALLMVGADVNVRDKNGKTILDYHALPCRKWRCCDEDKSKWCGVFKALAVHVKKLQMCQLEVCPANRSYVTDTFVSAMDDERFQSELHKIKNMKIEPYRLTLGDFLSEINAVYDYPAMSQSKKDVIDEFFCQEKMSHFREKYGEVAGLLSLQYRKAKMRTPLIAESATSLNFLANLPVPQICSDIIFGFLSNTDLKNFVASTRNCIGDGRDYKMDVIGGSLLKNKKLRIG